MGGFIAGPGDGAMGFSAGSHRLVRFDEAGEMTEFEA